MRKRENSIQAQEESVGKKKNNIAPELQKQTGKLPWKINKAVV